LALVSAGFFVYGTVRDQPAQQELRSIGISPVLLDITDEVRRVAVVEEITSERGTVDVLVNNAGYALQKPVEQIEITEYHKQFDTNVLGPLRLAQLVLPAMRQQGHGRIINVTSMGGRFTLAGGGGYHASKYALEALSDALRLEVSSFGVHVVLIEPGVVQSGFGTAARTSEPRHEDTRGQGDPYGRFNAELARSLALTYSGTRKRFDPTPNDVAAAIVRAATSSSPRARYVVGLRAKMVITGRRLTPDVLWDGLLRRAWPSN
jgi:NAD(P)-dependent dehydrogenase (short-subunit alcohol dehydrogenase family)